MATQNTDCYIGRNPSCGCIRFWVSDGSPSQKSSVLRAMSGGLHIERAVTQEAKSQRWDCEMCEPEKYQLALFGGEATAHA